MSPERRLREIVETREGELPEKGQERQLTVQAGGFFGLDVRPSRVFLWAGASREQGQRIVSLDRAPRVLKRARPRKHVDVGATHITYLGNPMVTATMAATGWLGRLRHAKRG